MLIIDKLYLLKSFCHNYFMIIADRYPSLKCLLCFQLLFFISIRANCQNYIFGRRTVHRLTRPDGTYRDNARVTNVAGTGNSELLVCSLTGASAAAFFNQPLHLSMCNKWDAEFDFRLFDWTGAVGLAFCFLDASPAGFVTGAGLGIPPTANGLKICFATWNNCIPFNAGTVHFNMPKIEIRWDTGYSEFINQSTKANSDASISFIRSTNYNHAKITYDNSLIEVFVNDSLYVTGYRQFNTTGCLGFTPTTGGYTDNHSIKNVVIYIEMPPSTAGNAMSFCPHDTVQLGDPSNPGYSYAWTPSAGLSDVTSLLRNQTDCFFRNILPAAINQTWKHPTFTAYSIQPYCSLER
jgi:hypothetical protein